MNWKLMEKIITNCVKKVNFKHISRCPKKQKKKNLRTWCNLENQDKRSTN